MIPEAPSLSSPSVAPPARGAALLASNSLLKNATQKNAAAGAALESPAEKKLREAAAEFEGMLLSNLWKSMKSTFAESDEDTDEDTDDPAHETLSDMGIQAMTAAVGKAGGLGLGKLIIKHLEPILAHSHNGKAPPSSSKASALPADTFLESR